MTGSPRRPERALDSRRRTGAVARPAFLDSAEIVAALAQVAQMARDGGARVALAGGCALQLRGSDRFTRDIDVLVDAVDGILDEQFPRGAALSFGGVQTVAANGVPVDLIARDDQYAALYADALAAARRVRGIPIPVVTLPYLAAMKLAAGLGKHRGDLEFILCDSGASWRLICRVIREHLGLYALDEIEWIRAVSAWRRRRRAR